jgi:hypothetical protein
VATNPSFGKRQKELARKDEQKEKARRREQKRAMPKATRDAGGEDPDIAGIIPGPQPIPEE